MPDFAGFDLSGGVGIGLGAGAVALVGRFGRVASSALQTYFRRNYTTKLEVRVRKRNFKTAQNVLKINIQSNMSSMTSV